MPIPRAGGGNTISAGDLQREFSASPGSFNTLGDGSVTVSPESIAGQQIITDWQAALGPFPLRFRPGGIGIPGWRRALASSSGGSGGSATASSIPLWLILVGVVVLVFVIFD